MHTSALIFVFLSFSVLGQADRPISKTLYLDNGHDWGKWGDQEFCNNGSIVFDIEVAFEDYSLLDVDETALNTVKLYCATPDGHHTSYITSTVGEKGTWKGMKSCADGMMTGMRAKVMPSKGIIGDDEALMNIEMECDHGTSTVLAMPEETNKHDGSWSSWATCAKKTAVCGLQIRYNAPSTIEDDAAISDMTMYCCKIDQANV